SLVVSLAQSGLLAGCIPPSLLVSSELSELDGVELGSLGDVEDGCSDSDGVTDSLGVPLSDESVLGSESESESDVAASSEVDSVSEVVSVSLLSVPPPFVPNWLLSSWCWSRSFRCRSSGLT